MTTISGFVTPGGAPDFGWTAYSSLSDATNSPGVGADLWIIGLAISGLGTILDAVNFITTVVYMRAPGMTMFRMPIFTWNSLITGILILMAFPILTAALLVLLADRQLGSVVFEPQSGGSILWQHLFWFFGHPEVYIVALPFFGQRMPTHGTKIPPSESHSGRPGARLTASAPNQSGFRCATIWSVS